MFTTLRTMLNDLPEFVQPSMERREVRLVVNSVLVHMVENLLQMPAVLVVVYHRSSSSVTFENYPLRGYYGPNYTNGIQILPQLRSIVFHWMSRMKNAYPHGGNL